jgi:hypothetical protein
LLALTTAHADAFLAQPSDVMDSAQRLRADGSVRVEFNTAGETSRDPDLINRVARAYDRRMGR